MSLISAEPKTLGWNDWYAKKENKMTEFEEKIQKLIDNEATKRAIDMVGEIMLADDETNEEVANRLIEKFGNGISIKLLFIVLEMFKKGIITAEIATIPDENEEWGEIFEMKPQYGDGDYFISLLNEEQKQIIWLKGSEQEHNAQANRPAR